MAAKGEWRPARSLEGDNEAISAIYEGMNRSQLKQLFKVDLAKVNEACAKVSPCGEKHGAPIWRVNEVAPHIVRVEIPEEKIAEHIRKMAATDLPMTLRKEFWVGEKARQEVLLKAGDLWPTGKVIQHVGELLKLVKMTAQLMADAVERQAELTDSQRAIIKSLTDGMLTDLRKAVIEKFENPLYEESNGEDDEL